MMEQKPLAQPRTWPFNWQLIRYRPGVFGVHFVLTSVYIAANVVPGLIEKSIFDTLSGQARAGLGLWELIALYVSFELARLVVMTGSEWYGWTFRYLTAALLRRNLTAAALRRPAALAMPVPAGDAISRYRDDVAEVTDFPTWLPWMVGNVAAFLIAVAVMARINLPITLVVLAPTIVAAVVSRLAWSRMLHYYRADRIASSAVSGFLGEMFGAVQAVKVAAAERHAVGRLATLNRTRQQMAVRAAVFSDLLKLIDESATTLGIGAILLLAGRAMSGGSFTVGDFALFVYYLSFATNVPLLVGTFLGDYRQQEVSIRRLMELAPGEPPEALAEPAPVYECGDEPPLAAPARTATDRLEELQVRGLTFRYADSGGGIEDIDLTLPRGSFTVITGRVGSGKTTLLRALLGLLPAQAGEIRWNGRPVTDRAAFFRPPRTAYAGQVPRLFSAALRENILLGLDERLVDLPAALRLSVLEPDVATLEQGLDTVVGPRGVRLSGGQVQRAAAARMFVRAPELLVFDDLSSALDVETEAALWSGLDAWMGSSAEDPRMPPPGTWRGASPGACLVVSHRRAVLRRATQVVLISDGRVAGCGPLDELLANHAEMRLLWQEQTQPPDPLPASGRGNR